MFVSLLSVLVSNSSVSTMQWGFQQRAGEEAQEPRREAGSDRGGSLPKRCLPAASGARFASTLCFGVFQRLLWFLLFSPNCAKLDFVKLFLKSLEHPVYETWSTVRIVLLSKCLYIARCSSGAIKRQRRPNRLLTVAIYSFSTSRPCCHCSSFYWKQILLRTNQFESIECETRFGVSKCQIW